MAHVTSYGCFFSCKLPAFGLFRAGLKNRLNHKGHEGTQGKTDLIDQFAVGCVPGAVFPLCHFVTFVVKGFFSARLFRFSSP